MVVEHLKQEGTLHSFMEWDIEDVGKDGSQLISTGFKVGGGYFWNSWFTSSLCILNSTGVGRGLRGMMEVSDGHIRDATLKIKILLFV